MTHPDVLVVAARLLILENSENTTQAPWVLFVPSVHLAPLGIRHSLTRSRGFVSVAPYFSNDLLELEEPAAVMNN